MNTKTNRLFTSESVTCGHPDKVCDRISDSLLDEILSRDPNAHVALETMVTTGQVHVAGEVTTSTYIEMPQIIRETVLDIGYNSSEIGFDGNSCGILLSIDAQSPNIAAGVQQSWESRAGQTQSDDPYDLQGAGDQGLMFGYACTDTPDFMPLPIWLAHLLSRRLHYVRQEGIVADLYPDGKTQVTVEYEGEKPRRLDTIVISSHHKKGFDQNKLSQLMTEHVVKAVLDTPEVAQLDLGGLPRILVNPAGPFEVGGPMGDAGVTGRKIIVDTYGGMARHGGGAFSGKDPSKVDRSATYAMRWVAKNIVAAGLASRCEVQVAYAIGAAHPVGIFIETFGTSQVSEVELVHAVNEVFDLRPAAIIDELDLKRPIYSPTSAYGHFGRKEFPWEQTNCVEDLLKVLRK
ncbi:MAG: methionine adenosyltransferase [Actinomycetaceae bacterium]|nr:methionine adenosyltransferase [Actinomycetaceae bacterium]